MSDERRHEIARGLDDVRQRISAAAADSGRDSAEVTVVVITKTWPVSDLEILIELGVHDLGENKHQEAEEKADALSGRGVRWHFVGQIQSNKAGKIAAYADVVHSVDSVRVAQRLNSGAHHHDRSLTCLVQVNLDEAAEREGRGGVRGDEVGEVAHAIETAGRLELGGVMGVAPLHGDAGAAYRRLLDVSRRLRADYPGAATVSAGMSGDLEAAVQAGATHVRVGSAVLGERRLNE
ncbi:MAG: YggS family pyridoxal phosphate-dependent enzyme [Nocardioidaceae bacterium]